MATSGSHDTTSGRSYHSGRLIGTVVAVVLLAATFVGLSWAAIPDTINPVIQQWLHPGSKLTLGESRIAHIPAEFIRRSPLFAASWDALAECSKDERCNAAPIVALRDEAIRLDWRKVFDYLIVRDDWGEAQESAMARDDFFKFFDEKGGPVLRNNCLPNIKFEVKDGGRFYDFKGFNCT